MKTGGVQFATVRGMMGMVVLDSTGAHPEQERGILPIIHSLHLQDDGHMISPPKLGFVRRFICGQENRLEELAGMDCLLFQASGNFSSRILPLELRLPDSCQPITGVWSDSGFGLATKDKGHVLDDIEYALKACQLRILYLGRQGYGHSLALTWYWTQ